MFDVVVGMIKEVLACDLLVTAPNDLKLVAFPRRLSGVATAMLDASKTKADDPGKIRNRNIPIWSRTRYHCATES